MLLPAACVNCLPTGVLFLCLQGVRMHAGEYVCLHNPGTWMQLTQLDPQTDIDASLPAARCCQRCTVASIELLHSHTVVCALCHFLWTLTDAAQGGDG